MCGYLRCEREDPTRRPCPMQARRRTRSRALRRPHSLKVLHRFPSPRSRNTHIRKSAHASPHDRTDEKTRIRRTRDTLSGTVTLHHCAVMLTSGSGHRAETSLHSRLCSSTPLLCFLLLCAFAYAPSLQHLPLVRPCLCALTSASAFFCFCLLTSVSLHVLLLSILFIKLKVPRSLPKRRMPGLYTRSCCCCCAAAPAPLPVRPGPCTRGSCALIRASWPLSSCCCTAAAGPAALGVLEQTMAAYEQPVWRMKLSATRLALGGCCNLMRAR